MSHVNEPEVNELKVIDGSNNHGIGRNALTVAVAGVVVGILSGAALGVVWWALAPTVSIVVNGDTMKTDGFQPQEFIAADIAFGALALLAGLLVTMGLVYMRREHLVSTLFAALLASAFGTFFMWLVGTRLGMVDLEHLNVPDSTVVEGPLEIHMLAIYLVWPIAAGFVISILALSDFLSMPNSLGRRSAR